MDILLISNQLHFADVLDNSFIGLFVQLTAYILPYFLIPAALKAGMGAFGALTGMINDRSRGLFDRQRKRREGLRAERNQRFRTGTGTGLFGQSSAIRGAGLRTGAGTLGVGARGRKRLATYRSTVAQDTVKNDAQLNQLALASDEGIAIAALSGGTRGGAEQASRDLAASWTRAAIARNGGAPLNQDQAAAIERRRQSGLDDALGISGGLTSARAEAAGQLMMQNKARAIEGGDWGVVQNGINRLHGNNRDAAERHSQSLRYFGMEGGRSDFASTGEMAVDSTGQLWNQSLRSGFDRAGAGKVAGGHTSALQAHADSLVQDYDAAVASGNLDEAFEAAHRMTALRNAESAGYTPEGNKEIIYDMLRRANIDLSSQYDTAAQFGAAIENIAPGVGAPGTSDRIRNRAALFERGTDPNQVNQQNQGGNQQQSDRRVKTNIKQMSVTPESIKLYRFNYMWDPKTTYIGVMAQDLLGTPYAHAVTQLQDEGYYRVDYAALGLKMVTLEEWQKNPDSIYRETQITNN